MWFAGYLWYLSLRETTVALNNSLYQSQCIFVYILSICLLGEWITIRKSFAIIISLGGVFLISFGTSTRDGDETNNLQGIICCLISAFLFAIYEVTVKVVEEKHYDKNYSSRDSMYFLGHCGIWCLLTGPIVIYACDWLGYEHFDLPDRESVYIIIEICIIDVVFNSFLVLAVTFMTPYLVGLGMLLVIPCSFVADYLVGKMDTPPGCMQIAGVALIVAGFLVLKLEFGPDTLPGRVYRKLAHNGDKVDIPTKCEAPTPLRL